MVDKDAQHDQPGSAKAEQPAAPVAQVESRFAVAPLPSAHAPVVFFDAAPFFAHYRGFGGSLTLSTQRQTSDAAGQLAEERVITAVLKAPLFALLELRDNINDIERREAEHAAAVAAAMKKQPGEMAH